MQCWGGSLPLSFWASPRRQLELDGKGLGLEHGGLFDALVSGPSVAELIAADYLSRARIFVPRRKLDLTGVRTRGGDFAANELADRVNLPEIAGDAIEQYQRRAEHQPAIAFCITVEHAENVADAFRDAGYRSQCVHGGLAKRERDRLIAGLGTGDIEVLTSCDLISEGLDVPAVGAVILLRPTKSLVLHLQQIGRGMRPAPGKDALIVLDHVSNTLRHGPPDLDRKWSLAGVEKRDSRTPDLAKVCEACGAVNPYGAAECFDCGASLGSGGRETPEQPFGSTGDELDELTAQRFAAVRAMPYRLVVASRLSAAELYAYARHHGYKSGWVWHRLREQALRQ